MSQWTDSARARLEQYLAAMRQSLAASGADVNEVTEDLRRHVEEEVAAMKLSTVTEQDVAQILARVGAPEAPPKPAESFVPPASPEPQARKRAISVAFPKLDIPCFISGDRTRVKQVFVNLLSNAVKYNRPGGAVTVDCSAIAAHRIRVSVRDTGAGLPPDKLAQLFQPFNRLGQEAGEVEGTGIGLVVTKRLVELMGGAIGVESEAGKGSVFWVELRVDAAPPLAAAEAEAAAPAQAGAGGAAGQRTLLYVEDNPANLKLIEKIVARRPDLHLLSARTGSLGIELAHSARPDVILMDINLPGMSGIKAMQILRADSATAHIPVVALSANAMPRDIERGLRAGFFRYLTKPIKVAEFTETMDVALAFAASGSRPEPASAA